MPKKSHVILLLAIVVVVFGAYLFSRSGPKSYEDCLKSFGSSNSVEAIHQSTTVCRAKFPKLTYLHDRKPTKLDCVDTDETQTVYQIQVTNNEVTFLKTNVSIPVQTWNESFVSMKGELKDVDKTPVMATGRINSTDGFGFLQVNYLEPSKEKFRYNFTCVENN